MAHFIKGFPEKMKWIWKNWNANVIFSVLQGVRASTVDACEQHNPCQNGGICISTDGGPICECSYIDFDGSYCEQSKSKCYKFIEE